MANYFHGVSTRQNDTSISTPVTADSGIAFVVGAVLSIGLLPVAGLTILGYILVLVSYLLLVFGLVLKGL